MTPSKMDHSPLSSSIDQKGYYIQQSRGRPHLAPSPSPHLFKTSNICSWSLWAVYIGFQLILATRTFDIYSQWHIYASLLAEVLITLPEMVFMLGTTVAIWKLPKSSLARTSYQLEGDNAPTVDVFITCAGEPVSNVLDTVKAATAQNYPRLQFRVLLLDDGNNPDLKQVLSKLGEELRTKRGPELHYMSRPLGDHKFGKAGNLQYGIEWTKERGRSEFIASLDADMIVEPDWLRRMVPHALVDDAVGLVNPPQVTVFVTRFFQHVQHAETIRSIIIHLMEIHLEARQI